MRLQSAIFDMDGTLLDSMFMWKSLGPYLLGHFGIQADPALQEKLKPMTLRQGAAYCREAYHLEPSLEELIALLEKRVDTFYRSEVQAKPGVVRFLSLLKMEGVWMYVATATDRPLAEAALRHAGIDGYFRGIITSGEVGIGKESPEIFERAMRRLQSNKKDLVIFEDSLHAIRTAKNAGFRVVGVYDDASADEQEEIRQLSDTYIRSFEEMFETTTLE